jgi:RNA polymerase sigma-70 factor (ECF subfamily)
MPTEPDTGELIERAGDGDVAARDKLLDRHRNRLRQMLAVRLDPRLAARVDPSDLVQETLAEAHRRIDAYLRKPPLPFYPWLRQIACDRLADHHRRHVRAGRRSVSREEPLGSLLSDASVNDLARKLVAPESGPSARFRSRERSAGLRTALAKLSETDREVLVLRHLEQMPPRDIAAVLGISEGAVYTRHLRALDRLRRLMPVTGDQP